jgi:hypothetical protein
MKNPCNTVALYWIPNYRLRSIVEAIAATEAREREGWDWDALRRAVLRLAQAIDWRLGSRDA